MKKKIAAVTIFIFTLVFPMIFGPLIDNVLNVKVDENRKLAEYPDKFDNDYFVQFDKYFSDHLPLRNPAIKLYNKAEKKMGETYSSLLNWLGQSGNYVIQNGVLYGKDDWLYWTGDRYLDYYCGTNLPTKAELELYLKKAQIVNDYFESLGKKFVILIVPNKSQIYSEHMPDGIKVYSQKRRIDMVEDYFKENSDLTFVHPLNELLAAKNELSETENDRRLYFMQDSHWTRAGAYVGSMALLDALNMPHGNRIENVTTSPYTGDLSKLVLQTPIDVEYWFSYRDDVKLSYTHVEEIYRCQSTNPNGQKLVFFGDSFLESMVDVVGKEFSQSLFTRRYRVTSENNYFKKELAEADVVVFEAIERWENQLFEADGLLDTIINEYGLNRY